MLECVKKDNPDMKYFTNKYQKQELSLCAHTVLKEKYFDENMIS